MNKLVQVKDYLQSLQNRIVAELEQLDGKTCFRRDEWQRAGECYKFKFDPMSILRLLLIKQWGSPEVGWG